MDYDKLIERLNQEAHGSDIEDLLLDAVAAIEVLRAKFRSRDNLVDQLQDQVYELTLEINRLRGWPGNCCGCKWWEGLPRVCTCGDSDRHGAETTGRDGCGHHEPV